MNGTAVWAEPHTGVLFSNSDSQDRAADAGSCNVFQKWTDALRKVAEWKIVFGIIYIIKLKVWDFSDWVRSTLLIKPGWFTKDYTAPSPHLLFLIQGGNTLFLGPVGLFSAGSSIDCEAAPLLWSCGHPSCRLHNVACAALYVVSSRGHPHSEVRDKKKCWLPQDRRLKCF